MQGLADGYFVIPYTIGDYLATQKPGTRPKVELPEFRQAEENVQQITARLLGVKGREPVSHFHKRLGHLLWDGCGMARNAAGLRHALQKIPQLREEFWQNLNVPGDGDSLNQSLERAGRVADFLELAELLCLDALERDESCGCHFREEHVDPEGECLRNDADFAHVAAWEYQGEGRAPLLNQEPLVYESVKMVTRNYK
jgi:succinate dehydrogenase / fumarate reductase flavoprotein subunit